MKYPDIIFQIVALQEGHDETHICYCVAHSEAERIVRLQTTEDEASVEAWETEDATVFCFPSVEYEIRALQGYLEDGGVAFDSTVFGVWGLWFPVEPQDQPLVAAELKRRHEVIQDARRVLYNIVSWSDENCFRIEGWDSVPVSLEAVEAAIEAASTEDIVSFNKTHYIRKGDDLFVALR